MYLCISLEGVHYVHKKKRIHTFLRVVPYITQRHSIYNFEIFKLPDPDYFKIEE